MTLDLKPRFYNPWTEQSMPSGPGEREIIRILTRIFRRRDHLPLDFDDDVAAIPWRGGKWLILKSDMLVASTDVPPGMNLSQVARKAVVATVSDFAAKGVKPKALLVSLGLPSSTSRTAIRQLAAGIERAAREYDCQIVGGDTNQSKDLTIDCLGVGEADPDTLVRRDGARPGDTVAVTGPFGNAAAGLRILTSRKTILSKTERKLVRPVVYPKARLKEGLALAQTRMVTSSIDSSDGLAWSLHTLARASNAGIHLDMVPLSTEAKQFGGSGISPVELALYGGEEYELVLTIDSRGSERVKRRVPALTFIGTVHKGPPKVTASIGGKTVEVEARGWEHFRRTI